MTMITHERGVEGGIPWTRKLDKPIHIPDATLAAFEKAADEEASRCWECGTLGSLEGDERFGDERFCDECFEDLYGNSDDIVDRAEHDETIMDED